MGSTYRFHCRQCDYGADVSGGPDIGFVVKTQTVFCPSCRELRDISIEYCGESRSAPTDHAKASDDALGCCWECGARELTDWTAGDPCPRCGGEMNNEGLIADWD